MKIAIRTLRAMSLEALRGHWRAHCKGDLPLHSSRDLLVRAIVYQQEAVASGDAVRRAERRVGSASRSSRRAASLSLTAGTVLVREWNGVPYPVTVTDEGFFWDGKTYRSLSAVATAITGARWNGPRFFKLEAAEKTS